MKNEPALHVSWSAGSSTMPLARRRLRPTTLDALTGLVAQLEAVLEELSGLGDVVQAIEDAAADLHDR